MTQPATLTKEKTMSFQWDRIGTFGTATEAETWCDRQNVDQRDREIKPSGDGYELRIRAGTKDDERPDGARW